MRQHYELTYPNTDSKEYSRARYHYLLQIIFGETIAIDYCRIMSTFAPTPQARDFLLQQQKEEDSHLELLVKYVGGHPRPQALISPALKKLDAIMSEAIAKRDYIECIFIQNFIVEGLNITLLKELERHADGTLSELCSAIIRDEIGHMEFGISEMKRILGENNSLALRKKLIWLQRKTLFYATRLAMTLGREAKVLGIPMHEFAENAVNEHFERIARAGFALPLLDKILFNTARIFLKII